MTPQRIQEGKNDTRMLKDGAREHAAASTTDAAHAAIAAIRKPPVSVCNFVLMLWAF